MNELVNFCAFYDINYNTPVLSMKFTFTDKEEETISDFEATMTEITDDYR